MEKKSSPTKIIRLGMLAVWVVGSILLVVLFNANSRLADVIAASSVIAILIGVYVYKTR